MLSSHLFRSLSVAHMELRIVELVVGHMYINMPRSINKKLNLNQMHKRRTTSEKDESSFLDKSGSFDKAREKERTAIPKSRTFLLALFLGCLLLYLIVVFKFVAKQRIEQSEPLLLSRDSSLLLHKSPQIVRRYQRKGKEDSAQVNKSSTKLTKDKSPRNDRPRRIKSTTGNPGNHTHVIPNNIIFTHYVNLLTTPTSALEDPEDVSLQANVRNTIALHPKSNVHFFTDQDCTEAIRQAMMGDDDILVSYFQNETKGMFKADICRGAALYNLGGLYFDVDIEARVNIFDVLTPRSTEFVTPTVHKDSNWIGFFQAFIGVTKQHPVMKRYLDLFVKHYNGTRPVKGPLGVVLLRQAFEDLHPKNAVLWEEVRYNEDRFPDVLPTVGKRRACHFLVAIRGTSIAPFYSRVRGSRMCGGKESLQHN